MIITREEKDSIKTLVIKGYCVEKRGLSICMLDVKNIMKTQEIKPYRYQISYNGYKLKKEEVDQLYKSIDHALDDYVTLAKRI